jgi:hypothetical protein
MKPIIGLDVGVPTSPCPYCGTKLDGAFGFENNDVPEPGDASICAYCGGIFIFDQNLELREPQGNEFNQLAGDRRILKVQKLLAEVKRENKN